MRTSRFKKTNPVALATDLFKKKDTTIEIPLNPQDQVDQALVVEEDAQSPETLDIKQPTVPEGMFVKCKKCRTMIYTNDLKENLYICPKCGHYHRISAYERIAMIIDEGTFEEWDMLMENSNPLDFPEYIDKLEKLQDELDINEGVVTGCGRIHGEKAAVAVMDARFMMASMGYNVGEKITRIIERSTEMELPLIIFTCSGGARMQEGMVSLMQMAKTSAAIERHHDAGLPYFVVLTDPTTGGVSASFAMLGDVILAEPDALIGFAGQRVIEQTIGQKLPKDFQRAEFALKHGLIDAIVERTEIKQILADLILMHRPYTVTERIGE